jgi:CBS domain containing-hemolysin-like protein
MLQFVIAVVCLAIAVVAMVMQKTYFYITPRELKRQANHYEPLAMVLWRAVGYGVVLKLLLWFVTAVMAGIGLVLFVAVAPLPLAVIAVGCLLLYTFAWLPNTRLSSLGGRITVFLTPAVVWLLAKTAAPLRQVHLYLRRYAEENHTGLFQRDDLIEMLSKQKSQVDNRIDYAELDMAIASLTFGTKLVRDVFVPRNRVKAVSANDDTSVAMLDDLHQTRHTRFPVYDGSPDNIVGTLYLYDLVEQRMASQPKVSSIMEPRVFYVHESDTLAEVLHTFFQTKHQLFVVINSFDEYLGIIALEDVLTQIIGREVIHAVDHAGSRQEVAARHTKKKAEPEPAQPEQSDEQVSSEEAK